MFELFALGMAHIADPTIFRMDRRREAAHPQVVHNIVQTNVPNLQATLNKVRQEAWKALATAKTLG